ncbi:MAG: BrnT family toxin [Methylococcales bacterium]|nr:MAG: BrnT family toxin [Methylococcales bacterium]
MRYIQNGIEFEWDDKKALSNIKKHGISFKEACDAFFDPFFQTVDATDDEEDELRDGLIGYSQDGQLLFVVHVEKSDNGYRIISARSAAANERKIYEGD